MCGESTRRQTTRAGNGGLEAEPVEAAFAKAAAASSQVNEASESRRTGSSRAGRSAKCRKKGQGRVGADTDTVCTEMAGRTVTEGEGVTWHLGGTVPAVPDRPAHLRVLITDSCH